MNDSESEHVLELESLDTQATQKKEDSWEYDAFRFGENIGVVSSQSQQSQFNIRKRVFPTQSYLDINLPSQSATQVIEDQLRDGGLNLVARAADEQRQERERSAEVCETCGCTSFYDNARMEKICEGCGEILALQTNIFQGDEVNQGEDGEMIMTGRRTAIKFKQVDSSTVTDERLRRALERQESGLSIAAPQLRQAEKQEAQRAARMALMVYQTLALAQAQSFVTLFQVHPSVIHITGRLYTKLLQYWKAHGWGNGDNNIAIQLKGGTLYTFLRGIYQKKSDMLTKGRSHFLRKVKPNTPLLHQAVPKYIVQWRRKLTNVGTSIYMKDTIETALSSAQDDLSSDKVAREVLEELGTDVVLGIDITRANERVTTVLLACRQIAKEHAMKLDIYNKIYNNEEEEEDADEATQQGKKTKASNLVQVDILEKMLVFKLLFAPIENLEILDSVPHQDLGVAQDITQVSILAHSIQPSEIYQSMKSYFQVMSVAQAQVFLGQYIGQASTVCLCDGNSLDLFVQSLKQTNPFIHAVLTCDDDLNEGCKDLKDIESIWKKVKTQDLACLAKFVTGYFPKYGMLPYTAVHAYAYSLVMHALFCITLAKLKVEKSVSVVQNVLSPYFDNIKLQLHHIHSKMSNTGVSIVQSQIAQDMNLLLSYGKHLPSAVQQRKLHLQLHQLEKIVLAKTRSERYSQYVLQRVLLTSFEQDANASVDSMKEILEGISSKLEGHIYDEADVLPDLDLLGSIIQPYVDKAECIEYISAHHAQRQLYYNSMECCGFVDCMCKLNTQWSQYNHGKLEYQKLMPGNVQVPYLEPGLIHAGITLGLVIHAAKLAGTSIPTQVIQEKVMSGKIPYFRPIDHELMQITEYKEGNNPSVSLSAVLKTTHILAQIVEHPFYLKVDNLNKICAEVEALTSQGYSEDCVGNNVFYEQLHKMDTFLKEKQEQMEFYAKQENIAPEEIHPVLAPTMIPDFLQTTYKTEHASLEDDIHGDMPPTLMMDGEEDEENSLLFDPPLQPTISHANTQCLVHTSPFFFRVGEMFPVDETTPWPYNQHNTVAPVLLMHITQAKEEPVFLKFLDGIYLRMKNICNAFYIEPKQWDRKDQFTCDYKTRLSLLLWVLKMLQKPAGHTLKLKQPLHVQPQQYTSVEALPLALTVTLTPPQQVLFTCNLNEEVIIPNSIPTFLLTLSFLELYSLCVVAVSSLKGLNYIGKTRASRKLYAPMKQTSVSYASLVQFENLVQNIISNMIYEKMIFLPSFTPILIPSMHQLQQLQGTLRNVSAQAHRVFPNNCSFLTLAKTKRDLFAFVNQPQLKKQPVAREERITLQPVQYTPMTYGMYVFNPTFSAPIFANPSYYIALAVSKEAKIPLNVSLHLASQLLAQVIQHKEEDTKNTQKSLKLLLDMEDPVQVKKWMDAKPMAEIADRKKPLEPSDLAAVFIMLRLLFLPSHTSVFGDPSLTFSTSSVGFLMHAPLDKLANIFSHGYITNMYKVNTGESELKVSVLSHKAIERSSIHEWNEYLGDLERIRSKHDPPHPFVREMQSYMKTNPVNSKDRNIYFHLQNTPDKALPSELDTDTIIRVKDQNISKLHMQTELDDLAALKSTNVQYETFDQFIPLGNGLTTEAQKHEVELAFDRLFSDSLKILDFTASSASIWTKVYALCKSLDLQGFKTALLKE